MNTIYIKRIYDEPSDKDGYRVLVDRLWPRGISKKDANLDEWNKEIAPSTELRKWFNHQEANFTEFEKRYREELGTKQDELSRLKDLAKSNTITLLYGAKNTRINQAVVLRNLLLNIS